MIPFYGEWTFHVLIGVAAAAAGGLGHRAWVRRRWSRPPAGVIHEAVLALDLVESTQLAIRYGDRFAMRACNFLEALALEVGRANNTTSIESTGDGCRMTFASLPAAAATARTVLARLHQRPAELASGPPLELRAGISYGVILLDDRGHRHGATINRAFRLMAVPAGAFVAVPGEPLMQPIPDRNRIFVDEDSIEALRGAGLAFREVGVCTLKGFTGFHRVFELLADQAPVYERRTFLLLAGAHAALAALRPAHAATPLLFHQHGHGLAFSPDGKLLLAPSEKGLAAYEGGAWWEAPGPAHGFSGFSVAERAIYSSGQPLAGAAAPAGLLRSTDGGRIWQALALAGDADLQLLAAGYRSGAIYVFNAQPNRVMPSAGLYLTMDEGKTWRQAAARGLAGEIHALAAHPSNAAVVAVGTGAGLYVSRDSAQSFSPADAGEPVTAVTFDHEGERILYSRALSNDLMEQALQGGSRHRIRLPRLVHDYVTCLAHSPIDEHTLAFATRKRDVYLSRDGGRNWRQLANHGEAHAVDHTHH